MSPGLSATFMITVMNCREIGSFQLWLSHCPSFTKRGMLKFFCRSLVAGVAFPAILTII